MTRRADRLRRDLEARPTEADPAALEAARLDLLAPATAHLADRAAAGELERAIARLGPDDPDVT